jgi:hypothetical protein
LEHQVIYATYEPGFGSWSLGYQQWRVKDLSGPEVLRVKNGIVSWPMKDADGRCSDEWDAWIWAVIFDHEIKQWIQTDRNFVFGWPAGCGINVFDWIDIMSDTAQVNIRGSSAPCTKNFYFKYDSLIHKWKTLEDDPGTPIRRAYFLAWPDWGVVPFWTWFWDLSTGMEPPSASYLWNLTPTNTSTDRSPAFRYSTAGFYNVVQNVTYNSPPANCSQGQVSALAPGPTGSININNDAAYTSSYSVTLSLRYEPTAAEMRFQQVPGLAIWGNWEPVAPTRAWTLSGKYVGDFPDGTHTVYVQYRTYWGVQGAESGDSIELDVTPPAGTLTLNGGALRTDNPVVQAVWSASDFYPGIQMSYSYYNQEDGFGLWSHWQSYSPTTRNFTFSGLGGLKTVLVRFKDAGGNITQKDASINIDWHTFLPLIRHP